MASTPLPKGITLITWNTKEGEKSAYRVRITRKDFKGQRSKVFDDLKEAKEYLALSKTVRGKKLIYSVEETEEEKYRLDKENSNNYSFEYFAKMYIRDYIETKPRETELQKRNYAHSMAFLNIILRTSILDRSITYENKLEMGIDDPDTPIYKFFGKYDIRKITPIDINNYIRTRKKLGLKPISIQREITFISNIFNKAKYFNDGLEGLRIPTRDYDRDLLKNTSLKREGLLSDEILEKVFSILKDYHNKEMYEIAYLSYLTSMRRSEVITLKQEQVKDNFIQLIHTKSGKPRKVYLSAQAQEFLKKLKPRKNDGSFFTYTILGFDRVFRELIKTRNKLDVKFHDFRKTCISKILNKSNDNTLLVANILGFASARKFNELHVKGRLLSTDTQYGAMQTFGHDNIEITHKHYMSVDVSEVDKLKRIELLKQKKQSLQITTEEQEELLELLLSMTS